MSPPNLSFAALWIPSLAYILYLLFLNPSFQSIKITCSHRPHHSDHLNSSEVHVARQCISSPPFSFFLHTKIFQVFFVLLNTHTALSLATGPRPPHRGQWPRSPSSLLPHSNTCHPASLHPLKSLSLSPFLPLLKLFSSMASPQVSGRGRVNIHWPRPWIWYFIHCSIQSFHLVRGFSSRSLHGESTCSF